MAQDQFINALLSSHTLPPDVKALVQAMRDLICTQRRTIAQLQQHAQGWQAQAQHFEQLLGEVLDGLPDPPPIGFPPLSIN